MARAQALAGRYRILVVAIDSCSDSVNTIPYIAGLVGRVDQLDMQIVGDDLFVTDNVVVGGNVYITDGQLSVGDDLIVTETLRRELFCGIYRFLPTIIPGQVNHHAKIFLFETGF